MYNQAKDVILVPPMIERDVRRRGRWTRSAYDCLFGDSSYERKSLFTDHFIISSSSSSPLNLNLTAHMSPPEDENLAVKATIRQDGGQVRCRYYPLSELNPGSYICFSANPSSKTTAVSIQASAFDPRIGLGGWIDAPLDKRLSGAKAVVGTRYTSPSFTCGAITTLMDPAVQEAWIIAKYKALLFGAKLKDPLSFSDGLRERSSLGVSYSPISLKGTNKSFVAALEIAEGSNLTFAISQHLALVRRVLNPFEDHSVVGITSYLSYGLKMTVPIDQSTRQVSDTHGVEAAVSYQMNKNWMLKAKCGVRGVDASVGFRMWTFPSLLVLLSGSYSPQSASQVKVGLTLQMENHGDLVYERGGTGGSARWERGKAVLQKHEASAADIRNSLGVNAKGVILKAEDENYNGPSTKFDGAGIGERFL